MIFLIDNPLQSLWPIFLGWYLLSAASSSRRQLQLKEQLAGYKARDAISRECSVVPHSLTVDMLVQKYMAPGGCRVFLVSSFSEPMGIVTQLFSQIKIFPKPLIMTTGSPRLFLFFN